MTLYHLANSFLLPPLVLACEKDNDWTERLNLSLSLLIYVKKEMEQPDFDVQFEQLTFASERLLKRH